MGEYSAIEWTDATWNPWRGCHKVSQGCRFCYAERLAKRHGETFTKVIRSKTTFRDPLKWKEPRRIFTCSLSDFFIQDADLWREEAWQIMENATQHTYLILTKRPGRIHGNLPYEGKAPMWPWPHIWLGVSIENRKEKHRIDTLRRIPAAVRFLSLEPLLEDLGGLDLSGIHWVIVGGESGGPPERALVWRTCACGDFKRDHRNGACFCGCRRWHSLGPFQPDGEREGWVLSLRDQCAAAGVPFFFKQWGGPTPTSGGRMLDGRTWDEHPS